MRKKAVGEMDDKKISSTATSSSLGCLQNGELRADWNTKVYEDFEKNYVVVEMQTESYALTVPCLPPAQV